MGENLYTHQDENVRKTWILLSSFFIFVMALGWFFSYLYNSAVILYIAVLFSVGMNIVSYWYSDKIVLSLHKAKQIKREDNVELWNIVENLSITAGLPMPKICTIEDMAPNAFATGRNKDHAVVGVTTGLLIILDKNELEGVIAHELAHIGNKDILLSTVAVVLVGFVSIVADVFLRSRFLGMGNNRESNKSGGLLIIVGVLLAILSPIFATLIQLAISRKREFLADATGALLTRYPAALASALQKISAYSKPMAHANTATAHLFISNPFGGNTGLKNKISNIFSTHPPTQERVKALIQ